MSYSIYFVEFYIVVGVGIFALCIFLYLPQPKR